MKNKFTILIFIIYVLLFIMSGCNGDTQPVEATGPQNPTSEIKGFYSQQQTVTGGAGGSGLNLVDIKIDSNDDGSTTLAFTFGQGNVAQDNSFTPSETVPKYEVSFLDGINRMVLSFEGVSYYSYKLYEDEIDNPLLGGIFAQRPVNTDKSFLYLNINSDYAYKAHELGNQIIITLHKVTESEEEKAYYVTLNAYDEYEAGYLDESFSMKPTLCRDKENVVLISKPFISYDEALSYIKENNEKLKGLLAGKKFFISEIENTSLPEFSEESGYEEISRTPIGFLNGEDKSFPALITNGRFLCFDSIGESFVYAQPNTIYGDQEGDSLSFEYLFVQDVKSGQSTRLIDIQFSSITYAQFSSDSKYLAFIEQNDVLRQLQILSINDGKLYIPEEDSFGIDTASFVWDDNKNILYAINGEFQSKQLLSYDLTDPDNVKVNGVFEDEFSESILQIYGNKIYYANRTGEGTDSEICAVDIELGECKKITDGNSFLLSPDGKNIIVNDVIIDGNTEIYRLRCFNMETETETLIYSGELINNVTWSKDGSRVYYSVYSEDTENEQYPYSLYYYNVSMNKSYFMMNTIASALYHGTQDDEVLLMCIFTYKNRPIPVTYQVK